jgi:hypothetical protein
LIEDGTWRKDPSRHDDLLSWPRIRAGRRPVSARSGRKEFIERLIVCRLRWTQSFPRTRWRPDCARAE